MAEKVEYILSLKDAFSSGIARMQGRVNSLERSIKNTNNSANTLGSTLRNALAVIGGAALGRDIVMTTARMDSFNTAIMAGSENSVQGGKNLTFLDGLIEKFGLDLESTTSSFGKFIGSTNGLGMEADETRKIFEQFSVGVSAMKLPAEQSERVFGALAKMLSTGTVQADEFKGMLAEALPGAAARTARALGMTIPQMYKKMEQGGLESIKVIRLLGAVMEKDLGGAAASSSQGLQSNLNRLNTEWNKLKVSIGEEFSPMIIKLIHYFKSDVVPTLRAVGGFIKDHATLFKALAAGIGTVWAITKVMTIAQSGLNMAMSAAAINPYVLAIGALVALFTALISEYKKWQALQDGSFRKGLQEEIGAKKRKEGLEEELAMFKAITDEKQKQSTILSERQTIAEGLASGITGYGRDMLLGRQDALDQIMGSGGSAKGNSKTTVLKSDTTKVEGTKPQNFYLNITNLIEGGFSVTTNNMKEGAAKVKEEVLKALIQAANDTAIVARNS